MEINMEVFEREFFIYRILAGYARYSSRDTKLKIYNPSIDVLYESQEIYNEIYREAKCNDCLTQEDIIDMMLSRGIWTDYDNNQLEVILPKHIEYFKVEIYQNFHKKKEVEQIRKYLNTAKTSVASLFSKKHSFDHYSQHGLATFARWQYIAENTTYSYDGHKYDFSCVNITNILDFMNKQQLSESIIRELSRSEPWKSMWVAGKKTKSLFSKSSIELSDDQRRLINWSGTYDSISEHSESPPEEMIDDDDAIDGWIIVKNKEAKKAKEKADIEKRTGAKQDGEQFIVASDKDEAKKIYDMNDPTSRMIIQQRLAVIDKLGVAEDKNFIDVQREINAGTNQIMRGRRG